MEEDIAPQTLDEVTIDDLTLKVGLSDNDSLLLRDAEGNDKKIKGSDFTTPSKLEAALDLIRELFPNQASADNQLADKEFVNSSIETNTANFRGTFTSVEELNAYAGEKTNNDYAFVMGNDESGNTSYQRYKYNGTAWAYEYTLNNSSFTAAQWAAITSGITEELVEQFKEGAASKTIVVTAAVYKELEDAGEIKTDVIYGISDQNTQGISVDQSYQPGSGNPQSGAAVEEALEDYAKTSEVYPKSETYSKEEIDAQNTYFTEEKVIGKWIDGKPVYEKTIDLGTSKSVTTSWNSLGVSIPNIKMSISAECCFNEYNAQIFIKPTSPLQGFCPFNIATRYITIKYTKTTD